MNLEAMARVFRAQQRIYRCIEDCLKEDGHHKSYEGAMEVSLVLPNMFEQERGLVWSITLHCYLLCDGRHETWSGKSLEECCAQMEAWADRELAEYEQKRWARDMGLNMDEEGEADGSVIIYGDKHVPA